LPACLLKNLPRQDALKFTLSLICCFVTMEKFNQFRSVVSFRLAFAIGLLAVSFASLVFTYTGQAQNGTDGSRSRIASPSPTPATSTKPPTTQPTVKPSPNASPTPDDGTVIDDIPIVIETNLVNLNVRVIDRNNRPVNDVKPEEFKVYEDGVEQQIFTITKEEVPVSYGLAIDRSASLRGQIQKVIDAGKTIIESNKPGDETFLISFISSDKITLEADFSKDKKFLKEELDNFYVEGGQTAVIDGVFLAAEKAATYKKGAPLTDKRRRALVVVTDGEDRNSQYSLTDLFEFLHEEDIQIYIIGFVNELDPDGSLIRKSKKEKAVQLINRLATETGGRAYYPTSLDELPRIAEEITKDLRTQYVVSYYPSNITKDGKFHAIRVTIADIKGRDKRIAITRQGRIAAKE